jgi:hypothetical protein
MIQPNWSRPQNTTISALITLRHVGVGSKIFGKFVKKYPEKSVEETFAAIRERYPDLDYGERQLVPALNCDRSMRQEMLAMAGFHV